MNNYIDLFSSKQSLDFFNLVSCLLDSVCFNTTTCSHAQHRLGTMFTIVYGLIDRSTIHCSLFTTGETQSRLIQTFIFPDALFAQA